MPNGACVRSALSYDQYSGRIQINGMHSRGKLVFTKDGQVNAHGFVCFRKVDRDVGAGYPVIACNTFECTCVVIVTG